MEINNFTHMIYKLFKKYHLNHVITGVKITNEY